MEILERHNRCTWCNQRIYSDDKRARFCSQDCLKEFEKSKGLGKSQNQFSFSSELSELQSMVVDFAKAYTETDEEQRLQFYEQVVERTATVLKWINASSLEYEQRTEKELIEIRKENESLERKLNRLLERAAELKKENKTLRSKVKSISVDTLTLCRLMLGVNEKALKPEIKKAYRQKAKLVHPDSGSGDANLFKAVTQAMMLLLAHEEMSRE